RILHVRAGPQPRWLMPRTRRRCACVRAGPRVLLSIIPSLPKPYRVRPASLADADALVAHRIGMFTDMGVDMDAAAVSAAFRRWLFHALPSSTYRAWVVETADGAIVAGGGVTVTSW